MMTNSRLNTRQIEIYKCFLYSDRVKKALATTLHAFHCLIVLQKMWGQLGRVPRSANHVMLLNANERRSISEEVRREVSDPPSAPDGVCFEQLFDETDGGLDSGSDLSDSEEKTSTLDPNALMLGQFAWQEQEKKKKRKRKVFSSNRMSAFLQTLPTKALYAFGNKLNVIVPLIRNLVDEGHRVIVFGRYLKMLCIVHECLKREQIPALNFNGQMTPTQRNAVLQQFKGDDANVLLITVGAGGEGITIVEADRVIIIDPSWNPTVDDQAIDRA